MTTAIAPLSFVPPDDFDPFAGPALAAAVPATAAQREVWAATWMGDEASLAFNEAVAVELRGVLDDRALHEAICDVVARHEALRATFSADGAVIAIAEPSAEVAIARHDWTARSAVDRETEWRALRTRVVTEPFDLLRGPLVRFELVRCETDVHRLVITAHHIVCDGWSFGVLIPELGAAYSARHAGRVPALAPAHSFVAYASASAEPEARVAAEAAERYWLAQFASGVPVLDLPTDRPRLGTRAYPAGRVDHVLGADLVRRVVRAGARTGASQFATLFGAFGMLLHRLGGGEDFVIGVPAAGQPACGMPRLVGHLVSMLPVRLRVAPEMTTRDVLAQARGQVLDAYEHQALTFGDLLARLPIARDPGRPPLVSVAFNVDRGLSPAALPFEALAATVHSVPRCYETFDLFVNAVELDGAITVECQYNRALYDEATVRAWLIAYECLLEDLASEGSTAATGEQSVGALRLTPADAHVVSAGPTIALPAHPLIHRLVEAQVARTPDAIAVDDGTHRLTYRELDTRANQLARHLRSAGIGRGAFVGLCLERTTALFVAMLAVLKAGGAYVPFDPGHPAARVMFMAEDAEVVLLLTEEAVRGDTRLASAWAAVPAVVSIDGTDAALIAALPNGPLDADDVAAGPEDPAYVIYTSGSTGRPKGVIVPHRSVVNLLLSVQQTPGMTADDVVLAITTLSFDIAVSETILPLTVGARVVLASREIATDGLQLRTLVERSGVTFIDATPATYRLLLAAGWEGGPHLRLICTGEALPRDVGEALLPRAAAVWNGYGPTETTVWSSFWRVHAPLTRVLIGRPIANTRAYVLDAHQRPVPLGVRGELFIGGAGVTSGYLRRPELTAERFVPDPFADVPGARMYRTGDVARLLADGTLECLGRTDHQVKLRGYRIELGEIEAQLGACPGVGACAVVVREDRPGDARLVAYMTPADGTDATAPEDAVLRAQLATVLPEYMLPQLFVPLAVLPLTPSGKIDRAALPMPQLSAADSPANATFVAPRTPAEQMVAELWAEALRVSRLSVHDDFFKLGGHSLMAAQVLGRLRRDHGVELAYRRIFEASTVERFAAIVAAAMGGAASGAPITAANAREIPHDPSRTSAPLTMLQHRIWRLEELDPATTATHVHSATWRLRGAIDAAAVQGALDDFVQRHDQLRTRFAVVDGTPMQFVDPDARIKLGHVDFSGLAPEAREEAAAQFMIERPGGSFDLAVAPLARVTLIALAPDEHLLYTVRHGLIWDGWSFDIFITDFCELLTARMLGRAPVLPTLPITVGDFAEWQRSHMASPEMGQQVAWWRAHLGDDLPTLELPTDHPRPAQPSYRGDQVYLAFTREEADRLTSFAQSQGATLFMLFLAAYNVLLHRYSGQHDLLVGTPVRARVRPETEALIGGFVNTVLLRFHVDPAAAFTTLMGRVRDITLDAFGHQEMPFELLGSKMPALRALFSMQDARARPRSAAHIAVEQVHLPRLVATNDLTLWTMSTDAGLLSVLNFSTDLFERSTAERFLGQLRTLLFSVLERPEQAVGRQLVLTPAERRHVLGALGEPADPREQVGAARSVFARIIATGQTHPEAVAVQDAAAGTVTYGQLLARAEDVRSALVASGVGAGARMAVQVDDVTARVAAILGVHAAGGTVLLLDTRDPVAYNRALVSAAEVTASVVLTDEAQALGIAGSCVALDALASGGMLLDISGVAHAPDDVAFLLHEVDETGQPTTVALPHATLDALVADVTDRVGANVATVAVPLHSAAAAATVLELLVPLSAGGQLVAVPNSIASDGAQLAEFIEAAGATLVAAPGATWRELIEEGWRGDSQLTALVTDGANPALVGSVGQLAGAVLAPHGHGAIGVWSLMSRRVVESDVLQNDEVGPTRVAYGESLVGARPIVLDALGEIAPTGVPGWLHLAGPAVDRAARLMAADARFVDAPQDVSLPVGARAFRTGERARRGADGQLEVLALDPGRLARGGRVIGMHAITTALRSHVGIADAAVMARADDQGDLRLVACIVPAAQTTYTETELRRLVRDVLPEIAVPQHFIEVESIARDPHDAPIWERTVRVAPWEASRPVLLPTTPAEHYVANVWQEMLGVTGVQSTDRFFDIGGHSLLCFRFIDRVARERGIRVSPRVVLLGTLEQVAAELDGLTGESRSETITTVAAPIATATAPASAGMFGRLKRMLGGVA